MQKRTIAICMIVAVIALVAACKKDSKPAPTGNIQHAITDSFYWRAKLDTTWTYHGDNNKGECNSAEGLCSSFLYNATFTFNDSANQHPHDSIIMSWVGKTFVTSSDSGSKAYTFSFSYPDSLSRTLSTEFTPNNGSKLTITSITHNGLAAYHLDTANHGYMMYTVKGTYNVNLSRHLDTTITKLTQGDFAINVMENIYP